ncbi:spermidine synthase [candidate division CSSED10-310 bacterium]|uniref:Spermidine synthase n=1 Tax=candidate division CSSED10-310 bacterium TaxID=2855610 RepID=A0ABV6YS28_UNCC1
MTETCPDVPSNSGRAFIESESLRLFLISFIILFFELVCIRWIPSYIRYLSYFTNFILLACFLGMGCGLLWGRRKVALLPFFPPLLLVFVIIVSWVKFELHFEISDTVYFKDPFTLDQPSESYLLLPFGFMFITVLFILISQEMGFLFSRFKPLHAYALNIGGSMAGIASFFFISLAQITPLWWFFLVAGGVFVLIRGRLALRLFTLVMLGGVCLIVFSLQKGTYWSPYYKITMFDIQHGGKVINVNNIGHQNMQSIAHKEHFYHVPYIVFKNNHYKRALIIGAGSGSDVSFALHYGVEAITAVEIDPVLYELGARYHPLAPYSSPRVMVHINDARSFLRNDTQTYDLIIYALPDSLTLTSSFANLRLESYLFTLESFSETRKRLSPGGLLVLYNYYREDWLIAKIGSMLEQVFGSPPAIVYYGGEMKHAVFLIGDKLEDLKKPLARIKTNLSLKPASDEWPFLYMKKPVISVEFFLALGMVGLFALILIGKTAPKGTLKKFSGHFFFLGAAFMLLETTSVVRFSLLFGNTWMVNSLVFFSILAMVMLAIWISQKFHVSQLWILYALLFGMLAVNFFLPLENLLAGNPVVRYFLSSLLLFSPIFLANLIFTQTFREEGDAAISLAFNILGAVMGGMFEYTSLIFGYRNLVLFVTLFYALSLLFLYRAMKQQADSRLDGTKF